MKDLCIIHRMQFGYHTDIYKWCQYLRDDYKITVLTFDYGKQKVELDGVEIRYIYLGKNRILNGARFVFRSILFLKAFYGTVLVSYFEGCRALKIFLPRKKLVLDIRTLSIFPNVERRKKMDAEIFRTAVEFDAVTVISEGLKSKLPKCKGPVYVLPLGADAVPCEGKRFDDLRLLYVGTFFNRELGKTIEGFAKAASKLKDCRLTYTIVGDGPEKIELESLAERYGVKDLVSFTGYISHIDLVPFLQHSNIGVSFIPLRDYYDHQPPTKTFEYALSGSYVIATATSSNAQVITPENGILIDDTPDAFADAIVRIHKNRDNLSASRIQTSMMRYTWKSIVSGTLKPILEEI